MKKKLKLTPTEQKVLQMVVDGKPNKAIAHDTDCSVRTIENHRYRISKKMGVNGTAAMVRTAIVKGLVTV